MIRYLVAIMEEGVKAILEIIKAAAESPLGILALMIICLVASLRIFPRSKPIY
jgi:hypothetical protein